MLYSYRFSSTTENKAYMLQFGNERIPVYCYMDGDDLEECGGGGWTLVMKIDGAQVYLIQIRSHIFRCC